MAVSAGKVAIMNARFLTPAVTLLLLFGLTSLSDSIDKKALRIGLATPETYLSHELQGFAMRAWLNTRLVMGINSWGVGSGLQIPLEPHYGLEYPLHSGNEHLYSGGPFIAGVINGRGRVAAADIFGVEELLPAFPRFRDHFWRTRTGIPPHDEYGWSGYYYDHGILTNTRGCDDDHDGKIDEDELDGLDKDGDWNPAVDDVGSDGLPDSVEASCTGVPYDPVTNPDPAQDNYNPGDTDRCHPMANGVHPLKNDVGIWTEKNNLPDHGEPHVDEDFGAVSDNDLYSTATDQSDLLPFPGHTPMGIRIMQKSYAWANAYGEAVLPLDYYFINAGQNVIKGVFLGLIMDPDVGPVSAQEYYKHNFGCLESLRTVVVSNPIDPGATPFALTILGASHPLDSLSIIVRFNTSGSVADSVLYDILSGGFYPEPPPTCQPATELSDLKYFISIGPFGTLNPGDTLRLSAALVSGGDLGSGPRSLYANVLNALALYGRGYHPRVTLPSPALKITQERDDIRLDWGSGVGGPDPASVWDNYNQLVHSSGGDCQNSSDCIENRCITVGGKMVRPGGRVLIGYNIYRSDIPSAGLPAENSFTLLAQYILPESPYQPHSSRPYSTSYVDSTLGRDKNYWYSVTSLGLPDIVVHEEYRPDGSHYPDTLYTAYSESPILENAARVSLRFSSSNERTVLVVPNPYRTGIDYTSSNQGWEGDPASWNEGKRLIKFIHLPKKCVIHIFDLSGDRIATLRYEAPPESPESGELSWNLVSESGRALASGVYVFSVESDLGRQIGKFAVIR